MARLRIHVEGQTEETFVNEILAPHLFAYGFHEVSARLLGEPRLRSRRGGIRNWPTVQREIAHQLRSDRQLFATTMVDYYALPAGTLDGWPGRASAPSVPLEQRAEIVKYALSNSFDQVEEFQVASRFIPFVIMHEFEALLFSDCIIFGDAIGRPDLKLAFSGIRSQFESPEHINDSPHTAPSKRILQLYPGYQKPLNGATAARAIGLEKIRTECPKFSAWLSILESIPASASQSSSHGP